MSRAIAQVSAMLLTAGLLQGVLAGPSAAQDATEPRSASTPGTKVYFLEPAEGATVGTTFKVRFGLEGMQVAPAGTYTKNTGHHHLIIDLDLPISDDKIPSDFNHLHFGAGQTEAEVTLPPGDHTLQLIMGDGNHVPHDPPVISSELHIHVVDTPPPATPPPQPKPTVQRPDRTPSPADARVYFVSLKDGANIRPRSVVKFGLHNMGVAPAGVEKADTGHHHLLIDTDLPPTDLPIPNDFNHLHFGKGQTETVVDLKPGRHTLQLILADDRHVPHDPPIVSEKITVTVTTKPPRQPPRRPINRNRPQR